MRAGDYESCLRQTSKKKKKLNFWIKFLLYIYNQTTFIEKTNRIYFTKKKKKDLCENVNVRWTGIRCFSNVALCRSLFFFFLPIVLDLLFFINEQPEDRGWVGESVEWKMMKWESRQEREDRGSRGRETGTRERWKQSGHSRQGNNGASTRQNSR